MDLNTHFDKITGLMGRIKSREASRASDAGSDREEIGELLELTGVNKKAFSWARALDKMESDKRDDVLRSFDALRDMLDPHWDGQSTPDMLDGSAPEDEEPESEEPEEEPEAAESVEPDLDTLQADADPETEEFNAAADEAMSKRVVPISFGGQAG